MQLGALVWLLCMTVIVYADICAHCHCDRHTLGVTCTGQNLLLRSVTLPTWADSLHIHHLSLRHLPHFTYNDNIKVLRINHCGLTHIHPLSLSSLPSLETLHLADNLLTELPKECFFQLPRLRILNLSRNRITNLSQLKHLLPADHILDQLSLDGNQIELSTVDDRLPLTRQLYFANTNMQRMNGTSITFTASSQCASSVACRNLLVPDHQWSILRMLDVSAHEELTVDASALKMLTNVWSVNFASARLPASFGSWLSLSSHVRHLNLSSAILSDSTDDWQWCGENLEWLDVSNIGLRYLAINADCKIRYLNANKNSIESVFLGSTALETVLLEQNNLSSWVVPPTGVALTQLRTFSLARNSIEYLPEGALAHYPQLQNLDISQNALHNLSVASFPSIGMQIRSLNISHNQLATFVHPVLPSLLLLDLSFNVLTSLDPELLAGLPLLQHFYLSSNVEIFSQCQQTCWLNALIQMLNLVELDLSNCRLSQLPDLSPFEALRRLDLSRNRLKNVDGHILPKSLQRLDVSQNHIHTLSNFTLRELSALKELDASRNPLLCECTLVDLAALLDKHMLDDSEAYYCFSGSWQYPLRSYLENVKSCVKSSQQMLPVLLNAVLFLMAAISAVVFTAFLVCRCHVNRWVSSVPFAYKPLATADATAVDL
ncbi:unnamed protein product [Toxocara canis]|uniref:Leucine-rich repeats and immunoglobulin-like domains protein 3 n=1 Tax=Toxocara canis TaxID=6265 RepID=A0A183U1T3_TOXCA|nr:unnamed protein product [Toxocara canis]